MHVSGLRVSQLWLSHYDYEFHVEQIHTIMLKYIIFMIKLNFCCHPSAVLQMLILLMLLEISLD